MDIMRQSACVAVNSISVYSYGFLFNCKTVGQVDPEIKLKAVGLYLVHVFGWTHRGST